MVRPDVAAPPVAFSIVGAPPVRPQARSGVRDSQRLPDPPTAKKRVLFVHGRYQQRGGEDSVVDTEIELLRARGHAVALYERSNFELDGMGRLEAGLQAVWSPRSSRELSAAIADFRPDVVHVHNTFPLISPSVYWAAARAGVPTVQTLHNFRLLCPQAMFLREGRVCEDCLGRLPWRSVARACYRGSRSQTAVIAGMLAAHRAIGTWNRRVTRYVALNEFCRRKFIEGGIPAERIFVKPNFVDMPEALPADEPRRGFLFVGRLSEEKGIEVLAEAARRVPDLEFRVAGDGPLRPLLEGLPNLRLLGPLPGDAVYREMRQARALVLPSICYENFPRTIPEAFACRLPVVGSAFGSIGEIVEHGSTGFLFEAGSAHHLAQTVRGIEAGCHDMGAVGERARRVYEAAYSAEAAYRATCRLYDV